MNLDQALQTFIQESGELLEEMEQSLLALESAEPGTDLVNAIFRAAHTIKGSAGLFGLDHVVSFTHVVESVLDRARGGALEIEGGLLVLLLECRDHVGALVDGIARGQLEPDPALAERGAPLLAKLSAYLSEPASAAASTPAPAAPAAAAGDAALSRWHLSLRFGSEVLRNGLDPLSFLRYLATLGEITALVAVPDAIPAAAGMDPEASYLGYELAFQGPVDRRTLEDVFEFVRDDCSLRILPQHGPVADYAALARERPEGAERMRELLVLCGSVDAEALAATLAHSVLASSTLAPSTLALSALAPSALAPSALAPSALALSTLTPVAPARSAAEGPKKADPVVEARLQEGRTLRVDASKLDSLINLVGELVIAAARANLIGRRERIPELRECAATLAELAEDVRGSAMQLRMVKIGATFSRFQRVVHDTAREIGKDVALVTSGEDTELDKAVVEKIGDPLTHLVRNAIDHGIEPEAVRRAAGKPARGTVRLNAFHDSGSIVIEVSDDGGGLKRDRILAKAVERGLVAPGASLTDAEILNLIFEPGFSTAEKVTNLSGRGVGMDVVKRNVSALRGSVTVNSVEGAGTTVTVRLPLTLAIIDGFLVGLGQSVFVVPLDMIEECVAFSAAPGHDYTSLRGEVLPFVRLRELFHVSGAPARRESIVVVRHGDKKIGLVVDALLGEFQTVIKPLGKLFSGVPCLSGSTILGSGEVGLILDVPALVETATGSETRLNPRRLAS